MKITLFTSNQRRHNYLINFLSNNCSELFVIQECTTIFTGKNIGLYNKNNIIENYFKKVKKAEEKIFKEPHVKTLNKNIKLLPIKYGDLNNCDLKFLNNFLKSDIYIVFGSSFIKGPLLKFLIKKKAINIHMGISPFYKGADCNFWALFDGNNDLVGATIHMLSKNLDGGDILFHAISEKYNDLYIYSMSSVKSAFYGIRQYIIKQKKKFTLKKQDLNLNLRISKRNEFNAEIIKKFNKKKIRFIKPRYELLLNRFVLKKKKFFD